ncbi:hypothetical protein KRIGEM_02529 [Komagataeibacter rhaeticus]|nr:hypothetical protein KRIGEM_02529 [Komagataeibacter rhaeticus]
MMPPLTPQAGITDPLVAGRDTPPIRIFTGC